MKIAGKFFSFCILKIIRSIVRSTLKRRSKSCCHFWKQQSWARRSRREFWLSAWRWWVAPTPTSSTSWWLDSSLRKQCSTLTWSPGAVAGPVWPPSSKNWQLGWKGHHRHHPQCGNSKCHKRLSDSVVDWMTQENGAFSSFFFFVFFFAMVVHSLMCIYGWFFFFLKKKCFEFDKI